MNIAWHFTGSTLRDGSPVPDIGQTLIFPDKIAIDKAGYHWSRRPVQALQYAPGPMLHKVSYGGEVVERIDRGVSSERTILASIDATCLLHRFAADQALSVAHLWNMPDIVREYLTTLDESKEDAAMKAAAKESIKYPGAGSETTASYNAWEAAWNTLYRSSKIVDGGCAWASAWDAAMAKMKSSESIDQFEIAKKYTGAMRWSKFETLFASSIDAAFDEFDRRVYDAFQIEVT